MQTWHCIALIVLSIAVFFYASFVDDIKNTADSSLLALYENSQQIPHEDEFQQDQNLSSTWAEALLVLESSLKEDFAISFHEESLESKLFLNALLDELEKAPVAHDMILGPFTNEIFSGNKLEILSSLISVQVKSANSLHIICKGHSLRAANLLSELIVRNYNRLITSESFDTPLPESLAQKLETLTKYQEQMDDLKVIIQEEMAGSPEESVEVMAIRSEIMQVDQEVAEIKLHLLQIDQIHKDGKNPNEYLHIPPIRDYGQVSQLADILKQLKSMRLDRTLNEFTRNQVEENILINSKKLEKDVISAIAEIKQSVAQLLSKKKSLQQSAFDYLEEAKLSRAESLHMNRYNKIKAQAMETKKQYEDATLLWMSCKSSFSLYRVVQ
jgi:hypothetical protein